MVEKSVFWIHDVNGGLVTKPFEAKCEFVFQNGFILFYCDNGIKAFNANCVLEIVGEYVKETQE